MTDRNQKKLTRRSFLEHGGRVGAGIAFAPFVLDLSACGSSDDDSSQMQQPSTPGTAGGQQPTTAPPGNVTPPNAPMTSGTGPMTQGSMPSTNPSDQQMPPGMSAQAGSDGSSGAGSMAMEPSAMTNADAIAEGAVLLGLYKGGGAAALQAAVKKLDFSWLKSGDTVLIKVATNSGYKHPTTTSPNGVLAMVKELKARGAGKVIVADTAGVEHVRLTASGRYGSTKEQWAMNGMDVVQSDADIHFFDDTSFNDDFFMATLPDGNRWPRGMYLPAVIKQADHILYMPRIGTHILAGNTIAHKSAIGWLRDDSRHDLHNDAKDFYEKYTEINYTKEIHDRFRMVVTVSEAILLHGGPDTGTNYALDPVLVTASSRMANHDAVASSILVTLNKNISTVDPGTMTYSAASAPTNNVFFANGAGVPTGAAGPWASGSTQTMYTAHQFEAGVTKDRAIARGWELSGGKPSEISVVLDGEKPDGMLMSGLSSHGEGLYKIG